MELKVGLSSSRSLKRIVTLSFGRIIDQPLRP